MQRGKIAVAMSGGVDSSVAAWLLKEQGHDIFGLTALMNPAFSRCCSDADIRTAQVVCLQLGIQHHVVDVSQIFHREIIEYFFTEYLGGRTPSPCAVCNRLIKFGVLLDEAQRLGATCVATGHYVRLETDAENCRSPGSQTIGDLMPVRRLLRGRDKEKDQSYFLALLTQDQLGAALFPLGEMMKSEVVALARRAGLSARASKESQELCFVDDLGPGEWITVRRLDAPGPGGIVNTHGVRIGTHRGIHHYTVGQRHGLGLATGNRLYVIGLDAARNLVIVGDRDEACRSEMELERVNWIAGFASAKEFRAAVQIRYRHAAAAAWVRVLDGDYVKVDFDEPQFAVAPGQLAVFYEGDAVLGGGWIRGPRRLV